MEHGFRVLALSAEGAAAAGMAELEHELRDRAPLRRLAPDPGAALPIPAGIAEALTPIVAVVRAQQLAREVDARARPRPRRAARPLQGDADMIGLVLAGARVLTPDEDLAAAWVAVSAGRIEAIGHGEPPAAAERVDLAGQILAPGFIDLHVHGGDGAHFMSGDPT